MIEQQHIPDEDTKLITKLIKDKVSDGKGRGGRGQRMEGKEDLCRSMDSREIENSNRLN